MAEKITEMNIKILGNGDISVTSLFQNGTKQIRSSNYESLKNAFMSDEIEIPVLPRGIIGFTRRDGYDYMSIFKPAHSRDIIYSVDKTRIEAVPFPHLIMFIKCETFLGKLSPKNLYVGSRIFAITQFPVRLIEPVSAYPYGNVYGDGQICWGGNRPDIRTLALASNILELFLEAPTNNDLNPGSIDRMKENSGKPFPDDYLRKRVVHNYDTLWQKFLSR